MSENHHGRNPRKKYKGIMKLLDTENIGYIIYRETEVFVTPFSLSSDTIKQGDMVSFNVIKTRVSNRNLGFEAVNVERFGVECHRCLRTGHKSYDCPDNIKNYWITCFKCGFVGHYAHDCDQKFYGWFDDKLKYKGRFIRRSCDCDYGCWLSLFGGGCRKLGVKDYTNVGFNYNSVLSSFHLYWPHLIECRFLSKSGYCYYNDDEEEDEDEDEEEELKCIVCVKREEDVKKVEEVEDCFILEFDPNELPNLGKLSLNDNSQVVDEDDVCILAEKGKVACRDYPHSRHLCSNNPFQNTSHESHCKMCYCYVCDIPAPCNKWTNMGKDHCFGHCDASDDSLFWRSERKLEKKRTGYLRSTPVVS